MTEIILLILLTLLAASLGKKIYGLFKINFSNFREEFVFSSGLGWAILSQLTLILYLCGLLNRLYFYGLILFIFIFVFPQIKTISFDLAQIIKSLSRCKFNFSINLLLIFLIVQILFSLIGALAPPTDWDGAVYHLTLPKSYLGHLEIGYNYLPSFINFPKNAEMLYLLGMILKSDILAKLIHFSMGIVLAVAIFSFARKYLSKEACFLASAIFYSIPIIGTFLSTTANVELFVYFYEFLAIYAFLSWWDNSRKSWLSISGLMIGFSMGVKYLGIISFFLILLGITIKILIIDKKGLVCLFKMLIVFISSAMLFSCYWYARNIILAGNPCWPLLYNIFGGLSLTPDILKYMSYVVRHGVKHTLLNFLVLPLYLTFAPHRFGGSYIGPLFFVFLPVLLFIKEKKRVIIFFLVFSGLYLTMWFWFLSQQQRFLSSVIPLLSICTAYTIERIVNHDKRFSKVIYTILFSWFFISTANIILDHKDEIPVVLGWQSRESYLAKRLWYYQDIDYINQNLPTDINILLVDFERCYYLDRKFTYGALSHQTHISYKNFNAEGLIRHLKELGITHILIQKDLYNRKLAIEGKADLKLFDEKIKDYSSLVKLLEDKKASDKYLELFHSGDLNLYKIKGNIY